MRWPVILFVCKYVFMASLYAFKLKGFHLSFQTIKFQIRMNSWKWLRKIIQAVMTILFFGILGLFEGSKPMLQSRLW